MIGSIIPEGSDLSRVLTEVVSAVPGVVRLYPVKPMAGRLRGILPPGATPGPRVSVTMSDSTVTVAAVVQVGERDPAPDVCRSVSAAIEEHLRSLDLGRTAAIEVTVAGID